MRDFIQVLCFAFHLIIIFPSIYCLYTNCKGVKIMKHTLLPFAGLIF
ncbi:hypothetical protein DFP79_1182 [Marinomonas balearica]|uniref:Uncharacterized protein n=1 Tax=Marinomonas balearica TaxID=491947 RepID=A0A4R6MDH3_9GAMM|nr:hypothetical protein DFP79_1182 [Marinomonas balearica]